MAETQSTTDLVYASAAAADAFARSLLQAHEVPPEDAAIIAGCLVSADLRGVDTHGLCRLPIYLQRVRAGLINPKPSLNPKRVTPVAASWTSLKHGDADPPAAYSGGAPGSSPVATDSPERDQSLYEPT